MGESTPFFPAFARVLFGRAPVNAAARALKEAARSEDAIGELAGSIGHFFGDKLRAGPAAVDVESGETIERRDRSFTAQVTFWAFLFQVLTPGCSCREAVRRVQLWWRERDDEWQAAWGQALNSRRD